MRGKGDAMALMTWGEKYSVGVKALDDQHAAFVGALNELHASILKGQAGVVAGPLLERLTHHVQEHFETEERLFARTNYPGLAEHCALHQELTRQVREHTARFRQDDSSVHMELLRFMRDWIRQHMVEEDQKYTAWLNGHGIR